MLTFSAVRMINNSITNLHLCNYTPKIDILYQRGTTTVLKSKTCFKNSNPWTFFRCLHYLHNTCSLISFKFALVLKILWLTWDKNSSKHTEKMADTLKIWTTLIRFKKKKLFLSFFWPLCKFLWLSKERLVPREGAWGKWKSVN
jgi:hypothetical protein